MSDKIYGYYYDSWNKTHHYYDIPVGHEPCGCCGASGGDSKSKMRFAGKGIRIALNNSSPAIDTGRVKVDHVQTKNGVVTVSVRYNGKNGVKNG